MITSYNKAYYDLMQRESEASARVAVPLILERVRPTTVLDVGCGDGTWLGVMGEHGVREVIGIDGDYVNRATLRIPAERFIAKDLSQPFQVGKTFDLAMALEVAGNLPEASSTNFVRSLCAHAPVVITSTAIPHQAGLNNINQHWPDFWTDLFAAEGFVALDPFRSKLWDEPTVAYYYAQNLLLYVRRDLLDSDPRFADLRGQRRPMALIHPRKWEEANDPQRMPLKTVLKAFVPALTKAIRRRIGLGV